MQLCLNQQVILEFKHHYAGIILGTLQNIIMVLIQTEISFCVVSTENNSFPVHT